MYRFIATYVNMDDYQERTSVIDVEEILGDSEREIYLYAMGKAYDLKLSNECFSNIEFICC